MNNPRIDGEQIDWNASYPDLEECDIDEVKSVIRILNRLAVKWETLDLNSTDWHKQYMISPTALAILQPFVDELLSIKYLINWLKEPINISQEKVQQALNTLKIADINSTLDLFCDLLLLIERKKLEPSKSLLERVNETQNISNASLINPDALKAITPSRLIKLIECLAEAKIILKEDKNLWAQAIRASGELSSLRAALKALMDKTKFTTFQLRLLFPLLKNIALSKELSKEEIEILFQASGHDDAFIDLLIGNTSPEMTNSPGLIDLLKKYSNQFTFDFIFIMLNKLISSITVNTKNNETITHKHEYTFSVMTQNQKEDLIKTGLVELNLILAQDKPDNNELEQKFAQLCKTACMRRGAIGAFFSPYSVHTHAAKALINKFTDHQKLLSALKIDPNKDVKAQLVQKMQASLNGTTTPSGPAPMSKSK